MGDCVVKLINDQLHIVKADPKIRITAELVDEIRRGMAHEAVSLRDDILIINAVNRRVIYRLNKYLLQPDCYEAEWPD